MPSAGFEPATPATKRLLTYALDRTVTGTGLSIHIFFIMDAAKVFSGFLKAYYEYMLLKFINGWLFVNVSLTMLIDIIPIDLDILCVLLVIIDICVRILYINTPVS